MRVNINPLIFVLCFIGDMIITLLVFNYYLKTSAEKLWNDLVQSYYYRRSAIERVNSSSYDAYNMCLNSGQSVYAANGFRCKCTPDYDGENCADAKTWKIIAWLKNNSVVSLFYEISRRMFWAIVPFLASDWQLKYNYTSHQNRVEVLKGKMFSNGIDYFARILPPFRSEKRPTEKYLPLLETLMSDEVFRRPLDADENDKNLLYYTFYQYFVLQYFNSDFELKVSASQLYGADRKTQRNLRSFSNGKLKTEFSKNEHYPPSMSWAKRLKTILPLVKRNSNTQWFDRIKANSNEFTSIFGVFSEPKWDMGHPMLDKNPMLFAMSTLWIREHNRVCDIVAREWPSWEDDKIHDTAKNIVIGEMMQIMMNEILSLQLKPDVYHDHLQNIESSNTPIELLLVTMWPSLPDNAMHRPCAFDICLALQRFKSRKSHLSHVFENGIGDTIKNMINGRMTHNDGTTTETMTRLMMTLSREEAVQSLNNYRRRLGLDAYRGFFELTGDRETAEKLRALYENVEYVELLPGVMAEKKVDGDSPTATALVDSFIVNSILTNSLTSKRSWTPDTFGGNIGFDIVKSATIKSLIYNNDKRSLFSYSRRIISQDNFETR